MPILGFTIGACSHVGRNQHEIPVHGPALADFKNAVPRRLQFGDGDFVHASERGKLAVQRLNEFIERSVVALSLDKDAGRRVQNKTCYSGTLGELIDKGPKTNPLHNSPYANASAPDDGMYGGRHGIATLGEGKTSSPDAVRTGMVASGDPQVCNW